MIPYLYETARNGHIICHRYGNYTQLLEVTPYIIEDLKNGNPNYYTVPITKSILKQVNAQITTENTYNLFMVFKYDFHTKELFFNNALLTKLIWVSELQDLHTFISGKPLKIEIENSVRI